MALISPIPPLSEEVESQTFSPAAEMVEMPTHNISSTAGLVLKNGVPHHRY
jgi:hypothetical protein